MKRERDSRPPPPTIPGYENLLEVSRGGQGVVFSAVQRSTGQRVAIKVLLEGAFASEHARMRFDREIDLVARLRHPNIVRVYDSGITDDHRSYLIMEFIDGASMDEHLGLRKADVSGASHLSAHRARQVAELFIRLADALQYAHQRGVIHRDMKPSNVRIDERGEPHILDFGLATIVEDAIESSVWHTTTSAASFMGSLPWASPEQARGIPGSIDVRSDVYALGVMLYQAISGILPYNVTGAMREALTNIVESPPRRLSTFIRDIDRDFETIILKCLAKEPERRYQSAGDVANDLRRYLKHEPVQARPDTFAYRTSSFVRRNRVPVTASAIIAAALLVGAGISIWQAFEATKNERLANRRFEEARRFARSFIFESDDAIRTMPGQTQVRELMVRQALPYLDTLAREAADDPALQLELAQAYIEIGNVQGRPNMPNLGDSEGARSSYDKAAAIVGDLADESTETVRAARSLHAEILAAKGEILAWDGDVDGGTALIRDARACCAELAAETDASDEERLRHMWAIIREADYTGHSSFPNLGKASDALAMYQIVEGLLSERQRLGESEDRTSRISGVIHERIGSVLVTLGDLEAALDRFEQSLAIRESMAAQRPDDLDVLRDKGISLTKMGETQRMLGRLSDAILTFERGVPILEDLLQRDPANIREARSAAVATEQLADALLWSGRVEDAVERMRDAVSLYAGVVDRDRNRARAVHMDAVGRIKLADMLGHPAFPNLGRASESIELYDAARRSFESLVPGDPSNPATRRYVGLVHERLGTMMLHVGRVADAIERFKESLDVRESLSRDLPSDFDVQRDVGVIHEQLGHAYREAGDDAASLESFGAAVAVYRSLRSTMPDVPQLSYDVAVALEELARIQQAMAERETLAEDRDRILADARASLEAAASEWDDVAARNLPIPDHHRHRPEQVRELLRVLADQ